MVRYTVGMLLGIMATPAMLLAVYFGVSRFLPDHLPAPAITILEPLDEKLRYLRERHDGEAPDIIVVGSSITWRQLDGNALEVQSKRGIKILNGGTGLLKTHQTRAMVRFYLDRFPETHTIATFVGLPDFEDCKGLPAEVMDRADAAAYAFEEADPLPLYLRYFAPIRYVRTGLDLPARRQPFIGDLWQDRYGSGPMQIPKEKQQGLRYGRIGTDPSCIDPLIALAEELRGAGRHFVIVFPPTHPDYWRHFPGGRKRLQTVVEAIQTRVRPLGATVVDMHADADYRAEDFWDAFHMQWTAVQRFSARLAPLLTGMEDGDSGMMTRVDRPNPGQPLAVR